MELHGGNIYKIAKELNIGKENIIDFSSNINPLGVSSKLKEEIIRNLDIIQNYPDPEYTELRTILAVYNRTDINNIIVGNGATELIYLFARVLKPAKTLIAAPSFAEYSIALSRSGSKISYFRMNEEDDFNININKLKDEINKRYDLMVLCNPNNPAGTYLKSSEIEDLISFAYKKGVTVMLDESFIEFADPSLVCRTDDLYRKYSNVFLLRSLTKFFAIPGLRLGYAVCYNNEILLKIKKNQEPWTVNLIAELAAKTLVSDKEYILKTVEYVNNEKSFMLDGLRNLEWLKIYYPDANFFLLKILNNITSHELKTGLLKHGILIRDASNFKYLDDKFVRIAVKDRRSNETLLERLNSFGKR